MNKRNRMRCPNCGGQMKTISFIERHDQPDVVEKILRNWGLWDRPVSRAPPAPEEPEQLALELEYVDTDEFLMALCRERSRQRQYLLVRVAIGLRRRPSKRWFCPTSLCQGIRSLCQG